MERADSTAWPTPRPLFNKGSSMSPKHDYPVLILTPLHQRQATNPLKPPPPPPPALHYTARLGSSFCLTGLQRGLTFRAAFGGDCLAGRIATFGCSGGPLYGELRAELRGPPAAQRDATDIACFLYGALFRLGFFFF